MPPPSLEESRARFIDITLARGDFVRGDDGYYMYWPKGCTCGGLSAYALSWLADELDKMNNALDRDAAIFCGYEEP